MPSIAAVLIVYNEENNLEACLESIAWVDEIVVLDAGSSDSTLAIAERYRAKCFINSDWQGFGKQRQLAQGHVSADWILMIDADERVTPALRRSIEAAIGVSSSTEAAPAASDVSDVRFGL